MGGALNNFKDGEKGGGGEERGGERVGGRADGVRGGVKGVDSENDEGGIVAREEATVRGMAVEHGDARGGAGDSGDSGEDP